MEQKANRRRGKVARMTLVVGFRGLGSGRLHAPGFLPSVWFWAKHLPFARRGLSRGLIYRRGPAVCPTGGCTF